MRKLDIVYVYTGTKKPVCMQVAEILKSAKSYSFLTTNSEVCCGQIIQVGPKATMVVINITEDYPATHVVVDQTLLPMKMVVLSNPTDTTEGRVWQGCIRTIPDELGPRTLSINLAQAREWYACGNPVLKKLALTAYSENELVLQFKTIVDTIEARAITEFVPNNESSKWEVLTELACIACYLNGQWKMKPGVAGYFIGKAYCQPEEGCEIKHPEVPRHTWILKHSTVMYPGLVYFKSPEAALQAVQMLGSRTGLLFT